MRVVVALSGGVDSAVAAVLLKEQGYEVIGVHLLLAECDSLCCGSAGALNAKRVAAAMGIPFYVVNLKAKFQQLVVEPFIAEYARGRTPNPCIECNRWIKFEILRHRAAQLGAGLIATGHYSRIVRDENGVFHLLKGLDGNRDQSYFLYTLNQEQLAGLLLPLGEYEKQQVRQRARELGLPNAAREESREICFIPDKNYANFLRERQPELFRPGPVYDTAGRLLGEHEGIVNFTIGQRKGLRMAFGDRRYVVRIDARQHAIYLGSEAEVNQTRVWAENVHWIAGRPPARPVRGWAKVRYQGAGGYALIEPLPGGRVYVKFDQPQWAPTPGQAVVFWDGDEVLGGGTIEQSKP